MALPVAGKVGTSSVYGNIVARTSFTPEQQRVMDAGGNYAGYAVVDGHYTYVGAGRTGDAARQAVYGPTAATTSAAGSATGKDYSWMNGPAGIAGQAGTVPAQPDPGKETNDRDAFALIQQTLATYGLPASLADWAWQEIVAGKSNNEILLDLRQRPEFKAEFPEIDARQKAGLAPLSPGEIVSYRQTARQMMKAAGLPDAMFDSKDDFAKYLVGDTSLKELGDRITVAAQAMYQSTDIDRAEARRFGITDGDLTAAFLDPEKGLPALERKWNAAQLSGTGIRTGFGQLDQAEALGLADQGVSQQQAQQGFDQLGQQKELFTALDAGESQIGRQDQLDAAFSGNAQAQQRIETRARRRRAQFSGGGGFAGGQAGLTGLGGQQG